MMTGFTNHAPALLSRFRRQDDGVAAIEFALVAPLLVMFLLGTTAATQSLWAHGKVAQTSSVIGDLVSQETDIDATVFRNIMKAAPVLMEPFPVGNLAITVTAGIACHEDGNGDSENAIPKIFTIWSAKWNGGDQFVQGYASKEKMKDAPTAISIENGDYIVQTRAAYTYTPTITRQAGYTLDMEEIAYHQPRDASTISFPLYEPDVIPTCDELMNN